MATDLGQRCNGEGCAELATSGGMVDLPGRRVKVLLCDGHQARLASGEALGIRQDRDARGAWGPTVMQFRA